MRRVALVVVGTATILSASACTPQTDNAAQVAAPASQLPAANIQGTVILHAHDVNGLGRVVVDTNGYTLYRFDRDTAKPPRSNCLDDCFPKWPPVIDTGDVHLDGVDPTLVGTVVRGDSTRQVTIAGWPIYRYSGDVAAGDAKGQGVGNVWFAITPTGKKAGAPAGDPSPTRGTKGSTGGTNKGGAGNN